MSYILQLFPLLKQFSGIKIQLRIYFGGPRKSDIAIINALGKGLGVRVRVRVRVRVTV
jgi:hypothetical protein